MMEAPGIINQNLIDYSNLSECVDFVRTQSSKIKEVEVETYLFKALSKTKSLSLLAHCVYLDANEISLKLMRDMFKPLKEALNELISLGMLDVDYVKIKMHRLVQSEMRSFIRNNPKEFNDDSKGEKIILVNLIKQLNRSLTKIDRSVTNDGSELSENINLEYTQVKAIIDYVDLKSTEETGNKLKKRVSFE